MVQFSSGTTGEPKPVALTHAQVLANASAILDIEPDDEGFSPSGVTWLPLYHDMGLIGCIFPALLYPASLTLIPPEAFLAKPAIWLRALSRYRGLISPAPNFAYALCTERIEDDEIEGIDLSGWRFALNGAEATSPQTMRFLQTLCTLRPAGDRLDARVWFERGRSRGLFWGLRVRLHLHLLQP